MGVGQMIAQGVQKLQPLGTAAKVGGGFAKLLPILSGALPIVGGIASGVIAGMNTRASNRYNSPEAQIKRAKAAHLPAASINNISAGNQSAVTPSNDLGTSEGARQIGQYNHNQRTIKEIANLQQDIKRKQIENDKLAGELQWYLSGRGEDPGGTNLTSMLKAEQGIKQYQGAGMKIANQAADNLLKNQPYKIRLDNIEQQGRINNIFQQYQIGGEQLEGYKKENALKDLELKWKPQMNQAQLNNLLADHGIKLQDIGLKQLQNQLETATQAGKIFKSDMEAALTSLTYDRVGAEFETYQQYQQFVRNVQDEINKPLWEAFKDPVARIKAIISYAYTATVNPNGQASGGNILKFLQ